MGKIFVAQNGICQEFSNTGTPSKKVSFPLHVLIKTKERAGRIYTSFILNVDRGEIFVFTERPLFESSVIFIKFLIPPNLKVLADFVGFVADAGRPMMKYPGMFIRILDFGHQEMDKLVNCLEEQSPLVDQIG